jgi:hypothetical protein
VPLTALIMLLNHDREGVAGRRLLTRAVLQAGSSR